MSSFPSSEAMLFSALAFAAHKHRDQRRKDAEASPYINHPIALARVLTVEGGVTDPTTLVAAILHDTIEDTETTAEELRELFGAVVTAVVLEVTDDKSLPKAERKRLQIDQAPQLSNRGKLVKLASYEPIDGRRHWLGRLTSFEDGIVTVSLETEGGALTRVPFAKLSHGRLEVEFPRHK